MTNHVTSEDLAGLLDLAAEADADAQAASLRRLEVLGLVNRDDELTVIGHGLAERITAFANQELSRVVSG